MVQPRRPTSSRQEPSSSPPFIALAAKILLVLLILFLLPKMVDSASRHRRVSKKALVEFQSMRNLCDSTVCSQLFPEERMNCIANCVSPACFQRVYGEEPLEDGEVDLARAAQFDSCAKDLIKRARARRREDALAAV